MVGINYTGTDGNTTSFMSSSADEAIGRLSRIPGYAKTSADDVAAGLAGGWRERHKARMANNQTKAPFVGTPGGQKYSSGTGIVSGLRGVEDIRVENGKLVKTSQQHYVSEGGKTVGVGPKRTETLAPVSSESVSSANFSISGSVAVVIGTEYSTETHKLVNVIGELSIKKGVLSVTEVGRMEVTTAVEES